MFLQRRNMLKLGLLGAVGVATAALWPTDARPPFRRKSTLILSSAIEPVHLVAAFTTQGGASRLTSKLFDGLVDVDLEGKVRPALAMQWSWSDDGRELHMRLREGVRWHDGKPFTSVDVVFSLHVWQTYNARGRIVFANVEQVLTPSPLDVTFVLSQPSPILLKGLVSFNAPVIPAHLYPPGRDPLTSPYNAAPVGTGPFRFSRWERGSYVELLKNDDYWVPGQPSVERLFLRTLPDPAAAAAALEAGSLNVSTYVPLSNIARLKTRPQLQVIDDPRGTQYQMGVVALEFNLDLPMFRDVRVRQAIAHCIDREFIVRNLYYGFASETHSPIPPEQREWHEPDTVRYGFDLARAEELLEQAGLPRDVTGIRLRFRTAPAASNPTHLQIAQLIRSNLALIGVHMEIQALDFGQFVNQVYTRRQFDTALYHATVGPDPVIGIQRNYWSKAFQPGVAFTNAANFKDAQVDTLLEQAAVELDQERRKRLYSAFQIRVQQQLPRIPIVAPHYPVVASAAIANIVSSSLGESGNYATAQLVAPI